MPFLTRNRVIEYPSALPLSCQEDQCGVSAVTLLTPRVKSFSTNQDAPSTRQSVEINYDFRKGGWHEEGGEKLFRHLTRLHSESRIDRERITSHPRSR